MINVTYGEAANQAEENALFAQGCTIVVRTDLLPQAPPPPPPPGQQVIAYQLTPETSLASNYLTEPDSDNLDFGTGDMEISFDFKLANLPTPNVHQTFFSKGTTLNNAWYLMLQSNGGLCLTTHNNNGAIFFAAGISDTTTFHNIKVKRVNGVTTFSLDTVVKGTTTLPLIDTTSPLYIGAWNYQLNSHKFTGLIKNVIITKG